MADCTEATIPLADLISLYWRAARVQSKPQPATDAPTITHQDEAESEPREAEIQ